MSDVILCSGCYDDSNADGFNAILPQSTCAKCGRECLGYRVSRPENMDATFELAKP
jgi:Na+-translocating ferredoxin:NAD+ oxidoreductase RNF subunit RnfB